MQVSVKRKTSPNPFGQSTGLLWEISSAWLTIRTSLTSVIGSVPVYVGRSLTPCLYGLLLSGQWVYSQHVGTKNNVLNLALLKIHGFLLRFLVLCVASLLSPVLKPLNTMNASPRKKMHKGALPGAVVFYMCSTNLLFERNCITNAFAKKNETVWSAIVYLIYLSWRSGYFKGKFPPEEGVMSVFFSVQGRPHSKCTWFLVRVSRLSFIFT